MRDIFLFSAVWYGKSTFFKNVDGRLGSVPDYAEGSLRLYDPGDQLSCDFNQLSFDVDQLYGLAQAQGVLYTNT